MLCGLGHRRSGDDSDTVGAIFGTLAGAFYGYRVIPPSWATAVTFAPFLVHVADCLAVLADAVVPTPTPGDSVTWTLAVDAVPRRTALLLQLMDTLQVEYTALRGRMQPGPRRLTDRAAVDAAIDEFGGRHRGWLVDHGALLSSAGMGGSPQPRIFCGHGVPAAGARRGRVPKVFDAASGRREWHGRTGGTEDAQCGLACAQYCTVCTHAFCGRQWPLWLDMEQGSLKVKRCALLLFGALGERGCAAGHRAPYTGRTNPRRTQYTDTRHDTTLLREPTASRRCLAGVGDGWLACKAHVRVHTARDCAVDVADRVLENNNTTSSTVPCQGRAYL